MPRRHAARYARIMVVRLADCGYAVMIALAYLVGVAAVVAGLATLVLFIVSSVGASYGARHELSYGDAFLGAFTVSIPLMFFLSYKSIVAQARRCLKDEGEV